MKTSDKWKELAQNSDKVYYSLLAEFIPVAISCIKSIYCERYIENMDKRWEPEVEILFPTKKPWRKK